MSKETAIVRITDEIIKMVDYISADQIMLSMHPKIDNHDSIRCRINDVNNRIHAMQWCLDVIEEEIK